MVNYIGLGQDSRSPGFICVEEASGGLPGGGEGAIEVGQVKKEGRVFPAEGHSLLLPSELSPLDASVQVSQL